MSGKSTYSLLVGEDCPECGEEMDAGSLRFNGVGWEHKSREAHPQAGHHAFDYTEALDSRLSASRENAYVETKQSR